MATTTPVMAPIAIMAARIRIPVIAVTAVVAEAVVMKALAMEEVHMPMEIVCVRQTIMEVAMGMGIVISIITSIIIRAGVGVGIGVIAIRGGMRDGNGGACSARNG